MKADEVIVELQDGFKARVFIRAAKSMIKLAAKIAALYFLFSNVGLTCSPGPVLHTNTPFEYSQHVVKGFYVSSGQFYIIESFDSRYDSGRVYPVTEYGPFGEACNSYELAGGYSDDYDMANIRYLKLAHHVGGDRKLTTSLLGEFPNQLNLKNVLDFSRKVQYGPYWLKPKRLVLDFRGELSVDFASGKLETYSYLHGEGVVFYLLDTQRLDRYLRRRKNYQSKVKRVRQRIPIRRTLKHPKAKRIAQRLHRKYQWLSVAGKKPIVLAAQGEEKDVWCVYDADANLLIPCEYSHIEQKQGYLLVEKAINSGNDSSSEAADYLYTVYDFTGKQLMPGFYESIEFDSDGLIVAYLNDQRFDYDPKSEEMIIHSTVETQQ